MPGGLPPFRVIVGAIDFTAEAENLTFSNADPGGYEICTFDIQANNANIINPGDRIRILDGIGTAWEGRVAEPAKSIRHGWHVNRKVSATNTRISGEGYAAGLKDNAMSMIYVDQDLSRWQDPSIDRQLLFDLPGAIQATFTFQIGSWQIAASANALPSLALQIQDAWVSPFKPIVEVWYDAGPLNLIDKIYMQDSVTNSISRGDGNWSLVYGVGTDLTGSVFVLSSNQASSGAAGFFTPGVQYRFAFVTALYNATPSGAANQTYIFFIENLAVYGPHKLPLQSIAGGAPGLLTSDIARDAAMRALLAGANLRIGQIDSITNYIVPHYVQYTPVAHDQIELDMAKLAPAHYGVWESDSIFDDRPVFTFRAYGTQADFVTSMADCDEADISERLANLYTSATITYQDASGTEYAITVTLPNALLDRVGIRRTNVLDIGLSSTPVAQAFANYVLQVLFAQARTAGTVQLPKKIRDRNGTPFPSYRLKSGIHRLRISDAPTRAGTFTGADTDSFRISRVENNVDTTSGQVTTRVELDAGPNLIETLTARLNTASLLGGQG